MTDRRFEIGETELRELLDAAVVCGRNYAHRVPALVGVGKPLREARKLYVDRVLASLSERAQKPATPAAITDGDRIVDTTPTGDTQPLRDMVCSLRKRIAELEAERGATPACAARRGKTDPPQDCDWPFCGCDPHATKVIEALDECGMLKGKTDTSVALPPAPDASPAKEDEVMNDKSQRTQTVLERLQRAHHWLTQHGRYAAGPLAQALESARREIEILAADPGVLHELAVAIAHIEDLEQQLATAQQQLERADARGRDWESAHQAKAERVAYLEGELEERAKDPEAADAEAAKLRHALDACNRQLIVVERARSAAVREVNLMTARIDQAVATLRGVQ